MSPPDARLVVGVGLILALRGPGVGRGEGLSVPGNQTVDQEVSLVAFALCVRVCVMCDGEEREIRRKKVRE